MLGLLKDWLLDPAALLFIISGFVIVLTVRLTRSRRIGWLWPLTMIAAWLLVYAVFTAPVVVNPLIIALESSVKQTEDCGKDADIVLLGGGVDSRAETVTDFQYMRPATFIRASTAAMLAVENPGARVIIAGGALKQIPEAAIIAEYMVALGVNRNRLMLETRSRSTRENALYVSELLQEREMANAVKLVTSALHMPRALGSFNNTMQGGLYTICPISVDFQGLTQVPWYAWMPQTTSLAKFDLLFHELIALTFYRFKSWI